MNFRLTDEQIKKMDMESLKSMTLVDEETTKEIKEEIVRRNINNGMADKGTVVVKEHPMTWMGDKYSLSKVHEYLETNRVKFKEKSFLELGANVIPRVNAENNLDYIQFVAGIIIFDKLENILYLDTTGKKDNRIVDRLTTVQGHVDGSVIDYKVRTAEEAMYQTAIRELKEEVNIDVDLISNVGVKMIYDDSDSISLEHIGYIIMGLYDGNINEDIQSGRITSAEPDKHDVVSHKLEHIEEFFDKLDNWAKKVTVDMFTERKQHQESTGPVER